MAAASSAVPAAAAALSDACREPRSRAIRPICGRAGLADLLPIGESIGSGAAGPAVEADAIDPPSICFIGVVDRDPIPAACNSATVMAGSRM